MKPEDGGERKKMSLLYRGEPLLINEQGIKWWPNGIWANGQIWLTELPTGEQEYVGIRNGELVANSTALDAVAVKLEMLDLAESPDE